MNSITTIIDADTLLWNLAYRLDSVDVDSAHLIIDGYVDLILRNTNCNYYLGFLGDGKTFRNDIYPEYKANRPENPEWLVKWKPFIRQRLITYWGFILSGNIEAEDACVICINYYRNQTNIVYAHIDKDGNSVGDINHYNFNNHTHWYTDKFGKLELIIKRAESKNTKKELKGTGLMWLYAQYCKGDKTDNIPSLKKGFGDVAIYNLLKDCKTEWQLHCKVYREFLKHSTKEAFVLNRRLIKMLDKEAYSFVIPELIKYKKEEINIFEL